MNVKLNIPNQQPSSCLAYFYEENLAIFEILNFYIFGFYKSPSDDENSYQNNADNHRDNQETQH